MVEMNRRSVMAGIGGSAAIGILGSLPVQAKQLKVIGLQLFTLRDIFSKDPVGTLERVAKIGYREVEFGGGDYDKMDHAMLRRTMDRLKLRAPSIHVPYAMLVDQFDATVRMAKTLGTELIVMPWLPEAQREEAAFERVIASLDGIAARLKAQGLAFAYHNHDFEFTDRSRGVSFFDRLMTVTDPALVKFELDLYWAVRVGEDIPALMKRLSSRLWSLHIKDMAPDRSMAAVGTGTIDFAAILRLPEVARVRHYYVENDQAPAPYFPDITKSYQTLSALRF